MLETSEQNIQVANCDDMAAISVRPPPGQTKFTRKSREMKITKDGYILTMCKFCSLVIESRLADIS
jgi:hypothetical protein